ncbi:MAG: hypothetical protein WC378_02700 [Opitutaceae bacterium]|jgi:hypothetical protein
MNLATIHDKVENTLKANPQKVEQRRKAIEAVRAGLAKVKDLQAPILRHRKAWFSTTQGHTAKGNGCARVQVLGLNVGQLSLVTKPDEAFYEFIPNEGYLKSLGFPNGPWRWSKSKKHGQQINSFLKECETLPGANADNEREIQWQLAEALRSEKGGVLRYLQPVTWDRRFTEIGVSVTASGKPGTGNIDLLVRQGKGAQGCFLVFELKKPVRNGVKAFEAALQQALRYATALNFEANKGGNKNLENYRVVLNSKGTRKLEIGAVVVVEDTKVVRENADKILKEYTEDRGGSDIKRLGVLLYKFDKSEGKAHSWAWLPGWPSKKLPESSQQTAG